MRSFSLLLILSLLLSPALRADEAADTAPDRICRAIPIIERHVNAWRAGVPTADQDAGYRALFAELRNIGFVTHNIIYDSFVFSRSHYFFDDESPHLNVTTRRDDGFEEIEFTFVHSGLTSKVTGARRTTDAVRMERESVFLPCLGDSHAPTEPGPGVSATALLGVSQGFQAVEATHGVPAAPKPAKKSWWSRVKNAVPGI